VSHPNPTPLRVGASGTLAGRTWTVAGRIVLSMDDAGERYYWNEYYLCSEAGEEATLVFEETEAGGEWRLFTLFEPETAIAAAGAARQHVGDTVHFEGRTLTVTLVDESRVEFIEGAAPEGVETGDVAHYFNAEGGGRIYVVSWTGDEVECYRGADLTAQAVADAFGLPLDQLLRLAAAPESGGGARLHLSPGKATALVFVFLALVIGLIIAAQFKSGHRRGAVIYSRGEAMNWPVNASGNIADHRYRVVASVRVEIAQVGRVHERQEVELQDDNGHHARLVCGLGANDQNWWLFTPLGPRELPAAERIAQLSVGQVLNVDGGPASVAELFRCRRLDPAGGDTMPAEWFGLTARTEREVLLALWNQREIQMHRGQPVDAKSVRQAFLTAQP
jgi:hypothetical protein